MKSRLEIDAFATDNKNIDSSTDKTSTVKSIDESKTKKKTANGPKSVINFINDLFTKRY